MPILPENRGLYPPPKEWRAIRNAILRRAGRACETIPAFPECSAQNYRPHPETGSNVVLTVAHMDHDPTNNDPGNLRALCQRCHLAYDRQHHAETRRRRLRAAAAINQPSLF